MQLHHFSDALGVFWFQYRSQIVLLVGLMMLLVLILSIGGVVIADGPITGGGGCSGC